MQLRQLTKWASSLLPTNLTQRKASNIVWRYIPLNNVAQVGPIVIFVLAFIMLAVYWIIFSPLMDDMITIHNGLSSYGFVETEERSRAVSTLQIAFPASVVFVVIVLCIWLILQALREREGSVY